MTTHEMKTVGVIGAGTMGVGVAQNAADHGFAVILVDRTAADAEAGKARIATSLDKQVERGKRDAGSRNATLARVTTAGDFVALGDADLIVEAAFEDLEV